VETVADPDPDKLGSGSATGVELHHADGMMRLYQTEKVSLASTFSCYNGLRSRLRSTMKCCHRAHELRSGKPARKQIRFN
jgi:hypothetical protein